MTLLAIETAYDVCGVALINDDGIKALEEQVAPRRHNELLAVSTERLLTRCGCRLRDLDAIAVSLGPGSYTGLRIGMSYAKGLAYGAQLPVIPVPTLPSLLVDEDLPEVRWIATWSNGSNVYAAPIDAHGEVGEIQYLEWPDFTAKVKGQALAGYRLERFQPAGAMSYVETCPSAAKVGKFALAQGLEPASDVAVLVPDYHHQFQPGIINNAHS